MAVFRIEKARDYTVMSNYHLRDRSLSLKAKGLLSLMLSLPEDWDYTMKGLARICKDGIDSISGGIRELEAHGYLVRARVRNENRQLGSIVEIINNRLNYTFVNAEGEESRTASFTTNGKIVRADGRSLGTVDLTQKYTDIFDLPIQRTAVRNDSLFLPSTGSHTLMDGRNLIQSPCSIAAVVNAFLLSGAIQIAIGLVSPSKMNFAAGPAGPAAKPFWLCFVRSGGCICFSSQEFDALTTTYIKLLKSGSALVIPFSTIVKPFRVSSLSNVSHDTILHDVPATIILPDS